MGVVAQDRPGLLYQVALALQHCGVRLLTAKIATYGERAEDIFFVTSYRGGALVAAQQRCLSEEVVRRLAFHTTPTADSAPARTIPI
jgi:[protein-PII] uridylyltransferase